MCYRIKIIAWMSVLITLLTYQKNGPAWADILARHEVQVNGVVIDVKGKEPAVPEVLEPRVKTGARTWIVQFAGPIEQDQKVQLEKLGCRLLDYLPDFAFRATMNEEVKNTVAKLPYIEGVIRFKPAYKLPERLRGRAVEPSPGDRVLVHLKLDDPGIMSHVLAMVERKGGHVLEVGRTNLRVTVGAGDLADLAALEEVSWIDEHVEMRLFNDTTRWVIQSNVQGNTKIWDKGLHGEEQIIGIGDTGVDYDMPWFHDPGGAPIGPVHRKIIGYDTTYGDDYDADSPGHGTHVAGTVCGDRTQVDGGNNANGMAPKSRIFIQDLTPGASSYVYPPDDLGQMFATSYAAGARLHTNSWGSSSNRYGPGAASADRFLWENRQYLALFANGNNGPGTATVGEPATAKNVISVGATYNGGSAEDLAPFSSNGPTMDGRIKPTVTAPGYNVVSADSDGLKDSYNSGTITMSGTSMATPAVAGAAALVRQYFTDGYYPSGTANPSDAFIPSSALIKAVLINSAQSMTGLNTDGPIPATGQGWGRVNLENALTFEGDPIQLQVAEEAAGLDTGATWFQDVPVAGGQPFKVTLVWTDYPGATGAAKALVNDLDLVVTAPDGTVFFGNALADEESIPYGTPDRLNVEEQVLVKSPAENIYRVSVVGYNIPFGPQPFAVAVTGASGVTSKGVISLDKKFYSSQGVLDIRLADRDLNRDPALAEKVTVLVTSGSEPAGEAAVLAESTPSSGIFIGKLPLASGAAVAGDAHLQVGDRDIISATYEDADDGSGRPTTDTATATVDNVAPVVSGVAIAGITETDAVVTWNTDEAADSVLNYGDTPALGGEITNKQLTTQHSMSLAALKEATTYYVSVSSTDEAGNTGKTPITFKTLNLPPRLTALSSEGDTTSQPSTIISGVSTDPSGVALVTVNGTEVSRRPSDGYFSLSVDLQVGSNLITVAATDTLGNEAVATVNVYRLPPVDLFMQAVAGPSSAKQNETFALTDTVCNGGPGTSTSFLVGFYLSADQNLTSDDTLIGTRTVGSLGAGVCSGATTQVIIPATAGGGSFYLIGFADYAKSLFDANRNNNGVTGNQITLPYPALSAPASLSVPATSSTGSFQAKWGYSNVSGVTYKLEYSKNGSPYTTVYSGLYAYANVTLPGNGSYIFRVKATKSGYADSAYTESGTCTVYLACGAPASISVPATSSTGSFQAKWGYSNVSGVTYQLEYSKDGAPYTTVYSGLYAYANVTLLGNGSYIFRVKATKSGYADSAYTESGTCTVYLACGAPASISVPATSSTGSFQASWGYSNVSGVTYKLEYSKDGAPYTTVYSGLYAYANVTLPGNGSYIFRVKATKSGYADSAYTESGTCTVFLACGAPASLSVPATSSTGSFQAKWGYSNVSGVTYKLEYSKNGAPYTTVYSGLYAYANVTLPGNGSYIFRVKATKSGYADSAYTESGTCTVFLACGAPVSFSVPATSSTGSFQASWGYSNVSGVTYQLEYSKNGAPYTTVYSGLYAYANVTLPGNGSYIFRVKATKSGYADSAYTESGTCTVYLACGAPASISVPATSSTGSFQASWGYSNVSGVTYKLEYSKDGAPYTTVYSGLYAYANVTLPGNGSYIFRVKATKSGYADSAYTESGTCTVYLACGAPASISVPATSSTGSFQASWGYSNVSGVTYKLEYSKDGGPYTTVYSGLYAYANVTLPGNGSYTFRVKATKLNYADSAWTVSSSVVVTRY